MDILNKLIKQLDITEKDVDDLEKALKDKKVRAKMLEETKGFVLDFLSARRKEKTRKKEKLSAQTKIEGVYKKIKQL